MAGCRVTDPSVTSLRLSLEMLDQDRRASQTCATPVSIEPGVNPIAWAELRANLIPAHRVENGRNHLTHRPYAE